MCSRCASWCNWRAGLSGNGRPVIGLPAALGKLQALLMELAAGRTADEPRQPGLDAVDNVASGRLPGLQALGIAPASLARWRRAIWACAGCAAAWIRMRKTAGRF
jgi:hypothetical protein